MKKLCERILDLLEQNPNTVRFSNGGVSHRNDSKKVIEDAVRNIATVLKTVDDDVEKKTKINSIIDGLIEADIW